MKDLVEIGLPSRNRVLIFPHMKNSRGHITPTPFDDLLLYSRNGPAIESMVSGKAGNGYLWLDSRRQLIYRIAHGLIEVVQLFSIHPTLKGCTYIGTG